MHNSLQKPFSSKSKTAQAYASFHAYGKQAEKKILKYAKKTDE